MNGLKVLNTIFTTKTKEEPFVYYNHEFMNHCEQLVLCSSLITNNTFFAIYNFVEKKVVRKFQFDYSVIINENWIIRNKTDEVTLNISSIKDLQETYTFI